MFNHYIKRKAAITLLFGAIFGTAISFLSIYGGTLQAKARNSESFYEKSDVDFVVPAPTKEQLTDLDSLTHIDGTDGFVYGSVSLDTPSGTISKQDLLVFDDLRSDSYSPYNSRRLIASKASIDGNPAYVDYRFKILHGINLGDTLSFSLRGVKLEYKVASIFENDELYNHGTFVVGMSDVLKTALFSDGNVKYSSAYISSNNCQETWNYLSTNYKPLGRQKSRSEFESDEDYQKYLTEFNSNNYSLEITQFQPKYELAKADSAGLLKTANAVLVASSIIPFVLAVVYLIVSRLIKSESSFLKANLSDYNGGENIKYFALDSGLFLLFYLISFAVASFVQFSRIDYYIVTSDFSSLFIAAVLSAFFGSITAVFANVLSTHSIKRLRKYKHSSSDKNKDDGNK